MPGDFDACTVIRVITRNRARGKLVGERQRIVKDEIGRAYASCPVLNAFSSTITQTKFAYRQL